MIVSSRLINISNKIEEKKLALEKPILSFYVVYKYIDWLAANTMGSYKSPFEFCFIARHMKHSNEDTELSNEYTKQNAVLPLVRLRQRITYVWHVDTLVLELLRYMFRPFSLIH